MARFPSQGDKIAIQPQSERLRDIQQRVASSFVHFLARTDSPRRPWLLTLAASTALGCGAPPEAFEEPGEPVQAPLINATPRPTRTVAALEFDIGLGPPEDTTLVWEDVRSMFVEASFGMQDFTFDLLGPYTLPVNRCLTLACCGPESDNTGNGETVRGIMDELDMTYDHYLWVYGDNNDSGCGTWGDAGRPNDPAVYCSFSFTSLTAGAQELGHNLGMEHEHIMDCGSEPIANDPSSCAHEEYGSRLSFMGRGRGHPSAFHKAHQGWLSGCNVVTAGGPATFTLYPLEVPCNGTQLLQIESPVARDAPSNETLTHYYVELRAPLGFDENLVDSPTVFLYAGPEISSENRYADHTYLLDLDPNSGGTDGFSQVGQTFTDPAGDLTITVDAISMESATISVSGAPGNGTHSCADGSVFSPPGASSCEGPATTGAGGSSSGGSAGSATAGSAGAGGSGAAGNGGTAGMAGNQTGGAGTGAAAGSAGVGGGTGGGAGTAMTSGGMPGIGGNPIDPPKSVVGDDSGCGCRAASKSGPFGTLSLVLTGLGMVWRRRPRHRAHTRSVPQMTFR